MLPLVVHQHSATSSRIGDLLSAIPTASRLLRIALYSIVERIGVAPVYRVSFFLKICISVPAPENVHVTQIHQFAPVLSSMYLTYIFPGVGIRAALGPVCILIPAVAVRNEHCRGSSAARNGTYAPQLLNI